MECKKTYSETKADRVKDSTIPLDVVEKVLQLLIEGCSVRSVERISGLHRDTILKAVGYRRAELREAPTLRVTPAMEAGISDHPWELRELLIF